MTNNIEVVLRRPPAGLPEAADFEVVDRPMPAVKDGLLVVEQHYQSLDPYIGSRIRGRHMGEPAPAPGTSLPGFSVGQVVASGHPDFTVGDYVVGEMGWARFGLMEARSTRKVDAALGVSAHLGLLGMPGLTAWAGVTQLARVGQGDVFTVDAAAGPVGGTAGQIARQLGARVIGIAGGPEKCALVTDEYRFDACVDYRAPGWIERFEAAVGAEGPSVHFENVGLSVLAPVMQRLKLYGRVVLCGMAEHYHADAPPAQIAIGSIIARRAALMGLVVYDFYPRFDEWVAIAGPWLTEGRIRFSEDVSEGLESAPRQFEQLMYGRNLGKALVRTIGS